MPVLLLIALLAYGLGSIPFGLLLTRATGAGDLRQIGSGNIGATNVLRTGRKGLAAATLLLDGAKAALAVWVGRFVAGNDGAALAAIFTVLGHVYPVWLRFRGGKGVASGLGALLVLSWPVGAISCAVWLGMALTLRRSSLSALVAFLLSPLVAFFIADHAGHMSNAGHVTAVTCLLIAALIWWRHRENIKRLLNGTEPRIGSR
jgi:glycerol-3-phosphate acyltransferase PlsY